eukprot:4747133-Amphidinium_carterae.1
MPPVHEQKPQLKPYLQHLSEQGACARARVRACLRFGLCGSNVIASLQGILGASVGSRCILGSDDALNVADFAIGVGYQQALSTAV